MKILILVLVIIAAALVGVSFRLYSLENLLNNSNEKKELLIGSNQALINSNARLEAEVVNLRKEVTAIKESFSKK
jgi:hypothetical protein